MKVLLINGSPNRKRCTFTALSEISDELHKHNIKTEIIQIGNKPIRGCTSCQKCKTNDTNRCVFDDDIVNKISEKAEDADGFIFGSPVYYASANGAMISVMDRLFYSNGKAFAFKPAASVVSARRAGTTAAYDQLNKYIGISNMIMVPAPYWNMVHGNSVEDVQQDFEGLQIMRSIGQSMAWLLNLLKLGKANGVELPQLEDRIYTNFVR